MELIDQHQEVQNQRTAEKRRVIVEENRKRDEEECTFQPKVLPRGSPRICTRPAALSSGERRWSAHAEQLSRSQRMKAAEAQIYADVTFRPKISRFAHVCSQRQAAAAGGAQCQMSVFERLYLAAQQADAAKAQDLANSHADDAGSSSTNTQQSPRLLNSRSELLYNDALDRRERQKWVAEQQELQSREVMRESHHVSERSRRYYWQMLERQIKEAFLASATSEAFLKHAELEDFLVHFGCARPRRDRDQQAGPHASQASGPGAASSAADDAISRLHASLWQQLDFRQTSQVDLVTLTVFFLVLMGAVDYVTSASSTASCPNTLGETISGDQAPAARAAPVPPVPTIPIRSSVTAAPPGLEQGLTSISEEEGATGDEGLERHRGGGAAPPGAESASDHDMYDLLRRFEHSKLRAEFHQLYINRMVVQEDRKPAAEKPRDPTPVPLDLNPQSRAMAAKLAERERCESEFYLPSHADVLLWRHSKAEARKEERRNQVKSEEVSECTFRPKISLTRTYDTQADFVTTRGTTRADVLYTRGLADRERREARAREAAEARSNAEVHGCTFRPDTAKSERRCTKNAPDGTATPTPRGFDKTCQRLREGGKAETERRQLREDPLARHGSRCSARRSPSPPFKRACDRLPHEPKRTGAIALVAASCQSRVGGA